MVALAAIQRTSELAASFAKGREVEAAGDVYQSTGGGKFWDAGTAYDQGRVDVAEGIERYDHLKGQSHE